ncbi:MAG: energy-coupling factor ABC transporter permease, partial [Elusimicrobiota bacterium]
GGTSVHLTGGVLAMVLLGPFSGLLIISCALIMHALLFQHGGVLTLGANILNIGVVNCVLGYYVYKMIPKAGLAWAGVVTWMGVITGAVFCTLELAFSNRLSPGVPVLSMAITYSIAGLIEGLMTFSILTGIKKIRPDSLNLKKV